MRAQARMMRSSRRGRLAVVVGLTLLSIYSSPAVVAHAAAASPTITGPVTGTPSISSTTRFDLALIGYEQSEFFVAGRASAYRSSVPLTRDGKWSVTPILAAPYVTRIVVYRPTNPKRFNGTAYLEWMNVTAGKGDAAAEWNFLHTEIARQGAVWIGASAQAVGVNGTKSANPARYASLSHPGDSFSYDIYSQVGNAVRDQASTVLGGLELDRLIGMGESQSALRLTTYLNAIHPLHHVYDGYLVHSRDGLAAPLAESPVVPAGPPFVFGMLIRDDLDVPVLEFETETDVAFVRTYPIFPPGLPVVRQPDSERLRLWEVAGTAHADHYNLVYGQDDFGARLFAAQMSFEAMLNPTSKTRSGTCGSPINAGPHHWVLNAALDGLNTWVGTGTPPATAPRLEVASLSPFAYALDANGNVLGGVRTPHVDVPVARLSGLGQTGTLFCFLFGTTVPFTHDQLDALYPTHGMFVSAWTKATRDAVRAGFLLRSDAASLIETAARSSVGD
jgi:hypothetical protein